MTELIRWDPFREMVTWRDAFERLFDDGLTRPFGRWPFAEDGIRPLALDVYETDDELIIEAPLPGMKPEEVDISITGNILTIKGETKREEEEAVKGTYHCRERYFGAVQRTITLPVEVNADKAKAAFKEGMLKLTMPKVEEAKPKHIAIKTK